MKVVVVKRAVSGSNVEVAIIGATCAGLVAARDLAAAGRSVRVIDVRRPGTGGGGLGLASAWIGPLGHRIALHHGEDAAIAYLSGLAAAAQEVREFAARAGVSADVAQGWGIAVDGHLAFQLRHEARLLRLAGIRVDFRDDQPFTVAIRPMLTVDAQVRVEAARYIAVLAQAAEDAGATIVPARVRRIAPGLLVTSAGNLRAADLIDTVGVIGASHAPAVRMLRDDIRPVVELRALTWPAGEPEEGPVLALSAWTDTPAAMLLAASDGATLVGRSGGDERALAAWARDNLSADVRATSQLATEESHDGLPVVGRLPGVAHAWVARGFGLADVSGGTWGGHQVASALLEDATTPATPLRALGDLAAGVRARFGVLADPKQRVAQVLSARGLSRRVSEPR